MPKVDPAYLESRRNEIVDAALKCFARNGFHRTTMQDIVGETKGSAGSIYRYFRSKEDIVAAIAAQRRTPDHAALDAAVADDDAAGALRDLVLASFTHLPRATEQRWRRITVQLWAEALRDRRVLEIVREGYERPIAVLTSVIRKGQHDGTIPGDLDPDATARVCASLFYGLVVQQALDPSIDVESYVDCVLDILGRLTGSPRNVR